MTARRRAHQARPLVTLLLVSILAALAAPGGASAKPKPPPSFVDGAWKGTAEGGGNISFEDAVGFGIGDVTFTLVVEEGQVVQGSMDSSGYASSDVPGANAGLVFEFAGELSGGATTVTWEGVSAYQGHVNVELLGTVPIGGQGPAYGEFSPLTATCSKVTGDFAAFGRELQKAAGAATNVKANFVAVRDTTAEAEMILEETTDISGEISAAVGAAQGGDVSGVAGLLELIERVAALQKHINKLKACGAVPPGFELGKADPYFSDLFRQLIDALLAKADQLETSQLITILYAAFQSGAVGKSSPDPAAALETLTTLVSVLIDRVDVHAEEGDTAALLEIYLAAQQMGLKDLATYAKSKLDE